jgi:hypothetical protein
MLATSNLVSKSCCKISLTRIGLVEQIHSRVSGELARVGIVFMQQKMSRSQVTSGFPQGERRARYIRKCFASVIRIPVQEKVYATWEPITETCIIDVSCKTSSPRV